MSSSIVKIGIDSIKTTVTEKERDINRLVKTFLSNKNNRKKIIGLDTERVQKGRKLNKTVLLQLCDGDNCLIVQLPDEDEDEGEGEDDNLPLPLFNFLNLPEFTFVGIGINKTMMRLESEFGLTCKNVVEIGPATWNLTNMTTDVKFRISAIVSTERPSNAVLEDWEKFVLNKNQIKLAASNAYFAFGIGNILLDVQILS
ncbi:unnamed protein product [Arabidopsis thaliana]|uniref:exoribonuclease II n=2 Tax=Arabidopsis thaliana TaxID=3702 RepID=Q9LK79_ARATH|nr:Polynucleotidyl transferase, ribonuclease H-like superfamily protein [Arabidopsis thaliana]AAU44581.1 hypothetical protein AT5G48350 [Arabidopsis thaliana]AED95657.1 Polynucleotidyl transferase, ribonuclease H-like superfamily protein [Arabidopsis thaliana]BAA98192.1 unnamed protein product [Arabidopsis thaliana]CAD5334314.1 unnamed protein product [Arabidopsis thaliana]|eukprot:NP_199646.1 Polynucleotidyl transferase, ribonuclease H-like superfamily protein [Arabidopsis thaliana]